MASGTILAVDVGGTFTDAVVSCERGLFTGKVPSTPGDQSRSVIAAARAALASADLRPADVAAFVHGMTVTTNALLEGTFARTALLATAGFTDIEELGRQNRRDLYRLCAARPAPIVPPELRFAITERHGPAGVIEPLDEADVERAAAACRDASVESVAVCLLFSFRFPEHELRVREIVRSVLPDAHVSLSHEAVGTFREYERCATTIADAALSPLLGGYLRQLAARAHDEGLPAPEVMLSNGGTVAAALAARNASWTVLSGPAGGAVGAARSAERAGTRRAIGFDMGGTSTDICVIEDGAVRIAASREIAGRPIALPAADVTTVGAGGGSIGWRDSGGALRVGPRSAGAQPGPACYGNGGDEPTVTDANLLLGYLAADSRLAGDLRLDRDAAERAVARLGAELGLDAVRTAAGIVEIANLEMLRATTAATVARGVDPREHALVAFGGAGPMHAAAIARQLGAATVICPAACGVLSAYGMTAAGRRRDRTRSVVRPLAEFGAQGIAALAGELAGEAAADLGVELDAASTSVVHELRYAGQSFELPIEAASLATPSPERLAERFHAAHDARYGFSDASLAVELVTIRVSVQTAAPQTGEPAAAAPSAEPATRKAWFDGVWRDARVAHALTDGQTLDGPLILEQPQATVVVPPDWLATARHGDVVLTFGGAAAEGAAAR